MCGCLFVYFVHVSIISLTHVLFKFINPFMTEAVITYDNRLRHERVKFIIYFNIAFTHFVENTRIQTTENSEKENSEITKIKQR